MEIGDGNLLKSTREPKMVCKIHTSIHGEGETRQDLLLISKDFLIDLILILNIRLETATQKLSIAEEILKGDILKENKNDII